MNPQIARARPSRCPDHTVNPTLFRLLEATDATGTTLMESGAMSPASSAGSLYFKHAASKGFAVGKHGQDQAADYAARQGRPLAETEKWLGPWPDY